MSIDNNASELGCLVVLTEWRTPTFVFREWVSCLFRTTSATCGCAVDNCIFLSWLKGFISLVEYGVWLLLVLRLLWAYLWMGPVLTVVFFRRIFLSDLIWQTKLRSSDKWTAPAFPLGAWPLSLSIIEQSFCIAVQLVQEPSSSRWKCSDVRCAMRALFTFLRECTMYYDRYVWVSKLHRKSL